MTDLGRLHVTSGPIDISAAIDALVERLGLDKTYIGEARIEPHLLEVDLWLGRGGVCLGPKHADIDGEPARATLVYRVTT